jgi:hypothetical protein
MKLKRKLATVILSTGLAFSVSAWAQSNPDSSAGSAGSVTDRPDNPPPYPSDSTSGAGSAGWSANSTVGDSLGDFASIDTNSDGVISRSEFASSSSVAARSDVGSSSMGTTSRSGSSTAGSASGSTSSARNATELFRELDKNDDGKLSRAEFDAYKATSRSSSGTNR